jgi:hypothetical protein
MKSSGFFPDRENLFFMPESDQRAVGFVARENHCGNDD